MTEPATWVRVQGPNGPTNVQLTAKWRSAVKARAGRGWHADYTPVAVKAAAAWLMQPGRYDAARDGPFSQAVRRRAYELAGK